MIFDYILVGLSSICLNIVVGAMVWCAIDDKEKSLWKWFDSCPPQVSWFAQPLVLSAWPVGVWIWCVGSRRP